MKNKKILIISCTPSHPPNDGPKARVNNLLRNLKKQGHKIYFLFNKENNSFKADISSMKKAWDKVYLTPLKYSNLITYIDSKIGKLGIFLNKNFPSIYKNLKKIKPDKNKEAPIISLNNPCSIDNGYPEGLDEFLKRLNQKEKFDAVIVECAFLSKALKHFPNSLKIIDTHLAITNKDAHEACNKKTKIAKEEYTFFPKKEEAKALNRADIIIAIQKPEEKFFKKILNKNKKIITIGNIQKIKNPIKPTNRKNILFVGSINAANEHGVKIFSKKIFPKIKKKFPDTKFIIIGEICKLIPNQKGIIKLGRVKGLEKAYNLADVIVCPLFFGMGLKIKSIEALSHSKPLITTSIGAKGLEKGKNKAFLIANTPNEFAKQISRLFEDKKLYEKTSKNAHNFMKQYNKENLKNLKEVFKNEK